VLDKVEGPGFLRAAPGIGDVVPSDVTAAGKLYSVLGAAPDDAIESSTAILAAGEAADISRLGYALNRDAWIDGLSVLGVPIWQSSGYGQRDLVAVLALAAATPRFERLGEAEVSERLLAAAERVGERLSGTGPARGSRRAAREKV